MARMTNYNGAQATATGCLVAAFSLILSGCGEGFTGTDEAVRSGDPVEGQALRMLGGLEIELSPVSDGTGQVRYVLTNSSDQSLRFLRRDTALEAAGSNLFDVRLNGEPIPFVGPHVYWGESSSDDFTELAPGLSVEVTVDLPATYAMSRSGQYTVRARRRSIGILGSDPTLPESVLIEDLAEVSISVDEVHVHRASDPTVLKFKNYAETCSTAELQKMVDGETAALALASAGRAHLNQIPYSGDIGGKYAKWFGDPARDWNDVRRAESVLTLAVGLRETQFTCRKDGDVVWVESDGSDVGCGASMDRSINAATNGILGTTVHVCPSFLAMSTRAMASVMIHEASHHAGTVDFVSTAADAQDLAITDPDDAVESGENYEQYVLEF
jgi:peptidyl-Lys metalloendopeptidase